MADTTSTRIEFDGHVQTIGDATILRFPDRASAELPSRGQVAVEAELNGRPFETVVEPDGMKGHWLAIDEELLRTLALDDGDPVTLEVRPTKNWPEPDVPQDFRDALAEASDIADTWDSITPMARWEWIRWIRSTKNPDTRARRVEVGISKLRSGKRRPCCFDLSACTDPDLSKNGKLVDAV
ncbi:YdeI/OmpD-associated family protein [Rhodococcus sp. NPDC058521]|uniref:YdeI/OmpD-associated family protein n=1 Tax=Rhodococcus sp. NPDC058521 TaxID=3346536 RepID=UPI003660D00C